MGKLTSKFDADLLFRLDSLRQRVDGKLAISILIILTLGPF